MNSKIQCAHCHRLFIRNPRIKNQRYCAEQECQRARKREWQKEKLRTDPDHKANQRACQIDWHARHPGYYGTYRGKRPLYCLRNKLLQRFRNAKARVIAKMDALKPSNAGPFYLVPMIAKMDASPQKVIIIPIECNWDRVVAKEYSMAFG